MVEKMPNSRLQTYLTALKDADEPTANAFGARLLERAYEKTLASGKFDSNKIIQNLPKGEKFNIVFGDTFKGRGELKQWIDIGERVGLIGDVSSGLGREAAQQAARSAGFLAAGAASGKALEAVRGQLGWLGGLAVKAGQAPIVMKFLMMPDGRDALARANNALTKWHRASRITGPAALEMMEQAQQDRTVAAADITALWNGLIANDQAAAE